MSSLRAIIGNWWTTRSPLSCIAAWLESADQFGEVLTERYPIPSMLQVYNCGMPNLRGQYECLRYYERELFCDELRPALVDNLNSFYSQKKTRLSDLTEEQRDVLKRAIFLSVRPCFRKNDPIYSVPAGFKQGAEGVPELSV